MRFRSGWETSLNLAMGTNGSSLAGSIRSQHFVFSYFQFLSRACRAASESSLSEQWWYHHHRPSLSSQMHRRNTPPPPCGIPMLSLQTPCLGNCQKWMPPCIIQHGSPLSAAPCDKYKFELGNMPAPMIQYGGWLMHAASTLISAVVVFAKLLRLCRSVLMAATKGHFL